MYENITVSSMRMSLVVSCGKRCFSWGWTRKEYGEFDVDWIGGGIPQNLFRRRLAIVVLVMHKGPWVPPVCQTSEPWVPPVNLRHTWHVSTTRQMCCETLASVACELRCRTLVARIFAAHLWHYLCPSVLSIQDSCIWLCLTEIWHTWSQSYPSLDSGTFIIAVESRAWGLCWPLIRWRRGVRLQSVDSCTLPSLPHTHATWIFERNVFAIIEDLKPDICYILIC